MNTHKKSSLGDLLFILRRNISLAIKKEGLKNDLTFAQVEVLHFIGPEGKKTMKSIAEFLKITPPSTTEIIAEMEGRGLVKRISDKDDRRIVYVGFTSNAKKLFLSIAKRKESIFKNMIKKLSLKDRRDFERIVRILLTD